MHWHPRSAWQSAARPVTGPALPWPQIDTVVIHYTAADDLIDGDVGEDWAGIPAYLRAIQSSYLNKQPTGYSVGYNWAVDQRGEVWELRGSDVKCAANRDHNDHCVAVLVLVDGDDQATPPAAAAIRALVAEAEQRAGRHLAVVGHGQLQDPNHPTGCPGIGLRLQIAAGVFSPRVVPEPDPVPAPLPPPIPTTEDHPMYYLTSPRPGVSPDLIWTAGKVYGIASAADAGVFLAAGALRLTVTADQYDEIVAKSA